MEQVKHFVIKGADIQLHPTNPITIAHLPQPSNGNSSYVSTDAIREEVVEGMEFVKTFVVETEVDGDKELKGHHEKFYVGYTEDIPEPLKIVFRSLWTCRYDNERHVHRNALLEQQLKACRDSSMEHFNEKLEALMKIRMVSNLSFWQRLKFLFTRNIECIKGYFDE